MKDKNKNDCRSYDFATTREKDIEQLSVCRECTLENLANCSFYRPNHHYDTREYKENGESEE